MKMFRTALLAAAAVGVAIPTLALAQPAPQDQNGDHPRDRGGDRGGDHGGGDRGNRGNTGGQPDRFQRFEHGGQQAAPAPSQPQQQQAVRAQDVQRPPADQRGPDRGNFNGGAYGRPPQANNGGAPDRHDFNGGSGGRPGQGDPGRAPDDRRPPNGAPDRGNIVYGGSRPAPDDRRPQPGGWGDHGGYRPDGPRGYADNGYRGGGDWNRPGYGGGRPDWRQDRRYDWRGYRDQHRDAFRAPRYVAPRGWGYGYRRFDVGFRLPPFLFGADYWIADPWAYRLPPVEGPYRWVRYYDDVLLIDLRTGEIVDEIPDFFW